MNKLVNLISPFKERQFRSALKEEPELLHVTHNGWSPLEWCRKYGNIVAEVAILRCQEVAIEENKLFEYLNYLSDEYLSSQWNVIVVDNLWDAIVNNKGILEMSDDYQIELSEEQVKDIEYIFQCLSIYNGTDYQNIVAKI